jgi:hypothetical protein
VNGPRTLRWHPGILAHIARHGVTLREVEEVNRTEPIVRTSHSGRLLVIGPTLAGRMLTVVLDTEKVSEKGWTP